MEALYQLVSAATSLQTSPPPAIAAALAQQSRDDLQRCGRVTSQLRNVNFTLIFHVLYFLCLEYKKIPWIRTLAVQIQL